MKLPSLDPDLRPQDRLLLDREVAGLLVVAPVVGRVVGDIQDLLAKGEIAADFPRAHDIATKCGFGPPFRSVVRMRSQPGLPTSCESVQKPRRGRQAGICHPSTSVCRY